MRSAVIDLGSNTFHALVADIDGTEIREVVLDDKVAVRLGEHAFARRYIADDAQARGLVALALLLERVRATQPETLSIVATGVFREADNGARFLAEARRVFAIDIELLDGETEARLTWAGVANELGDAAERLAVLDLGGGSLECALGTTFVESARSLPLGVLRLRDHLPHDTRALVRATARPAIDEIASFAPDVLALSSGSARALLRVARMLGLAPAAARWLTSGSLGELATLLASLMPRALDELGIATERRDTIAIGAIIFDTIVHAVGARKVYVARAALREGLLSGARDGIATECRSGQL